MMAALRCRSPLGGVILGGVHWFEGPVDGLAMERRFMSHIDHVEYRRHGATGSRRRICDDGARREVVLSGAVVASTSGLTRSMCQYLL